MAESTQRLSDDVKGAHPEVDWQSLARFRNVLVHNYLGVSVERIAETMKANLPVLKDAAAAAMLAELDEDEPPP